MSLHLKKENKL